MPTPAATGKANSSERAAQAEGDLEGDRRPPGRHSAKSQNVSMFTSAGVCSSLRLLAQ